ncbi:hypothetical protein [Chloroherpeton thalassium]|uniref:hypothetical protein n=1 Tax=Chloroherpeton thalassium TaxID=100716 RepID=UPI00145DA8EF|nr:hypothetical protein [Chloroherpeton thalassium]
MPFKKPHFVSAQCDNLEAVATAKKKPCHSEAFGEESSRPHGWMLHCVQHDKPFAID